MSHPFRYCLLILIIYPEDKKMAELKALPNIKIRKKINMCRTKERRQQNECK